jgi:5-methylcytosine-specific restriction endonuclease McrA
MALHIALGGIKNGDLRRVKSSFKTKKTISGWVVPKKVKPDDDVVIFFPEVGFFTIGKIESPAFPKKNWKNRYGADVGSLKPIHPSISLATIRSKIPELIWANYPRSITTPTPQIAEKIQRLINDRQRFGVAVKNLSDLRNCSLQELRATALKAARSFPRTISATTKKKIRSVAVKSYALCRAEGRCENCLSNAPFINEKGDGYLEVHHMTRLSDDGPDIPLNVIALCPNCHRKAHHSIKKKTFNDSLKRKVKKLELSVLK